MDKVKTNNFDRNKFRVIIKENISCDQSLQDDVLYFIEHTFDSYIPNNVADSDNIIQSFDKIMEDFSLEFAMFLLGYPQLRYITHDIDFMCALLCEFFRQATGVNMFGTEFKKSETYKTLFIKTAYEEIL